MQGLQQNSFWKLQVYFKQQFNDFRWNVLFTNTRDHNGYNFCTHLRYIINGLTWNRTICLNQKQVHFSSLTILNKIGKDFWWLFYLFKTKFNKAKSKRIATYFKEYQPSHTNYYGNKWYLALISWYHDK